MALSLLRGLLVDGQRADISLDRLEGLGDFLLALSVLTNDPESDPDDEMRSDLGKRLANVGEDSGAVLWVHFDHFSDEENCLEGCEGRFTLELKE